ncbi:MAG: protein-tyrosine-phosphatase [Flavobacteriales bacterium CG_4_9_14_3_um_filter_32_8]|nr:MAG: protein-tyrosine-phosphatase [Flavobacteriales bacterium CG_4_9_14_3_um_filter_32_8]
MKKILFVWLGNICRSAIAEGILRNKIDTQQLNLVVDSAGTCSNHVGQAPDQRMQQKAIEHGLSISKQRARQFSVTDFDDFDYIFAMDNSNYQNILRLAKNENDRLKVELFLNLSFPHQNLDVPDPYFGGEQGFEDVYQLVNSTCTILLNQLKNEQ